MRPDRRRWSPVQTLTGVVVGMLLAGLIVPMLVNSPSAPSASGANASAQVVDAGAAPAGGDTASASAETTLPGAVPAAGAGPAASAEKTAAAAASSSSKSTATTAAAAADSAGSTGAATAADTTPIKLGFTLFDVGGASKLGFAIGADPSQEKQAWQAFVDYVNSTNGINGHKITPVWSTYDLTSGDSQQQSCLELTQDNHVFAVLGGYSFSAADLCVVDANRTLLFNNNAFTIDELYNTGRHASIFMKASRMMANFAKQADANGLIKGKKIGIIDDLGADPTKSVINTLADQVKGRGGNVVHETILPGDFGSGSSQVPIEVSQMHAAGVDVVLLLASPLYGTQFVQEANSQGWAPTYAGSDWDVWYTDTGAENMPDSFNGAWSFVTVRTGEQRTGAPEAPQAVKCRGIFEQMTKTKSPERGSDFSGLIMQTCDTMLTFAAAARAAGPTLDQASFIAGTQRLGFIDEAAWGGGTFGPGKLDLNDRTRVIRWSSDCKCWKPTTPFE